MRAALPLVAVASALVTAVCVSLGSGDAGISPAEVARILLGGGDTGDRFIVVELRMPRVLVGALVGAALGLAGAITQTVARNPLASPDVLGVSHGAGAAVTAVIVLGGSYGGLGGVLAAVGVPLAGLVGGLAGGLLVYVLAWRKGVSVHRLLLAGIGVSTLLANVTLWLLTVGQVSDAGRALVWITGSLADRGWAQVTPVALALAVLAPPALLASRTLGVLAHDDDTAAALGVHVERARAVLLLTAVLLASFATAAAGPILFVALACPQIAVRLTRAVRPPPALSMLLGALLLVVSDLVIRTAFGAVQLPVGVATTVLGAAYLLFLLLHRREVPA